MNAQAWVMPCALLCAACGGQTDQLGSRTEVEGEAQINQSDAAAADHAPRCPEVPMLFTPPPSVAVPGIWGNSLPDLAARSRAEPFAGAAKVEWLEGDVTVLALSGDGGTLVGTSGYSNPTSPRAFRWRRGEPIEWLGETLQVSDVSDDGDWIAGTLADAGEHTVPVRIGPDNSLEVLGNSGTAVAISADGSVVVGRGTPFGVELATQDAAGSAFRWSQTAGFEQLPLIEYADMGGLPWEASDVSGDGSLVVGSGSVPGSFTTFALRWTQDTGVDWLAGNTSPILSKDGSLAAATTCGCRYNALVPGVLLPSNETIPLGFPVPSDPGKPSSVATCINADGSVVFGTGQIEGRDWLGGPFSEAYVWRREVGTQTLIQLLRDSCIDVPITRQPEWRVVGVSANSRLIVVCSVTDGPRQCWLAGWE